jgi:hypothetical protein
MDPHLMTSRIASWVAIVSLFLGLVTLGPFDVTQNTSWNSTDILSDEDERDVKSDCRGKVGQAFVALPAATTPAAFLLSDSITWTPKGAMPSFDALWTAVSRGPPLLSL